MDWIQQAACKGKTGPFFSRYVEDLARARDLCAGCPVNAECLEYAMNDLSLLGIWAGLTVGQRNDRRHGSAATF